MSDHRQRIDRLIASRSGRVIANPVVRVLPGLVEVWPHEWEEQFGPGGQQIRVI